MKIKLSWKWVIMVSMIFVIFISFVLPQVNNYSNKMIGQLKSPDTSFIYSAENLYNIGEIYGESGREVYIKLRWTFDLIWPIVYTLFLVLWTIKLYEYISLDKFSKFLFVIPICGMIFDFLENIGATIIMFRYPLKSGIIANITPFMTFLKWIALSTSILIIIILVILIIFGKTRNRIPRKTL